MTHLDTSGRPCSASATNLTPHLGTSLETIRAATVCSDAAAGERVDLDRLLLAAQMTAKTRRGAERIGLGRNALRALLAHAEAAAEALAAAGGDPSALRAAAAVVRGEASIPQSPETPG